VAMSGGVDSSVAAALFKEQGFEVVGVFMHFWKELGARGDFGCCSTAALESARRVAQKLEIPFYTVNFQEVFKRKIVDYFLDTYRCIRTPNPCVECNRYIKFGAFLKKAKELKADYIATGHYARVKKKGSKYHLLCGKDKKKDQSYFLYTLAQNQLKHVLFPVGGYTKAEVQKLAKKYNFKQFKKRPESQDACFYPEKTYEPFLRRHLPKSAFKKGKIRTVSGEVIGEHKGLPFYTIGQRKGLEIGGLKKPLYVVRLDKRKNEVIVGGNKDCFTADLGLKKLSFISGEKPKKPLKIKVKIRYRASLVEAVLDGNKLIFGKPQRGITPGQSVVFYEREECLGGGIIR